jgi:hypothetical protein
MSYGGHGGKIHDLQVAKKLCIGIYVTYNLDLCCSVHARARAHTYTHLRVSHCITEHQIYIQIHMEIKHIVNFLCLLFRAS